MEASASFHRRHGDQKLANQLAAFGLLGRTNLSGSLKPVPPSTSLPTEAPERCYSTSPMPVYDFPPFNPIYVQGEGFRGWMIPSEGGRVRFVPVRASGPAKKSGGTGVFLPRMSVKDEVNKRNNWKRREQSKPQQPQKVGPILPPRHELVGPALLPSSVDHIHMSSLLPRDWSY